MPPKDSEGGRSTDNSRRSLFVRAHDPIPPSGGDEPSTPLADIQDVPALPIPPSGGDDPVMDFSSPDTGKEEVQDSHAPFRSPVRGDDTKKSPAAFRRQ